MARMIGRGLVLGHAVLLMSCLWAAPASAQTGVIVNGRPLTPEDVIQIRSLYGLVAAPGRYWYDTRSGLWGGEGRQPIGLILPGHAFGPLSPRASAGNTGIFINGREINMIEALYIQRLFGAAYRGYWWLDGRTGYLGLEGNPTPVANVFAVLQQAQRGGSGGGAYSWWSATARGASDGKCGYVNAGGSTVMFGSC